MALAAFAAVSIAGEAEPLPDSLQLQDALRLANGDHPALRKLEAERQSALAAVERALDPRNWKSELVLDGRTVDKVAIPGHAFRDDSSASLYLRKLLIDFGQSEAALSAAEARHQGLQVAEELGHMERRLDIMEKFTRVRLADLRYFVDDEDMTLAFLRYDRVRERRELFQEYAEVDEKELETVFRDRLVERTRAAHMQRRARNELALAMGRPGELVDRVVEPDLAAYQREVPDYDELLAEVLAAHPVVRINRLLVESAQRGVEAAELAGRPELRLNLEATAWSFEVGNRDQYVAGVELSVPLGDRGVRAAELAGRTAELSGVQASALDFEYRLRSEVLELVQRLQELEFELQAAEVNEHYRDLYLDRSRALYEMEVRSDLGDSQARQAEAVWRSARIRFERALIWARLDMMRGLPLAILEKG